MSHNGKRSSRPRKRDTGVSGTEGGKPIQGGDSDGAADGETVSDAVKRRSNDEGGLAGYTEFLKEIVRLNEVVDSLKSQLIYAATEQTKSIHFQAYVKDYLSFKITFSELKRKYQEYFG